MAQYKRLKGTQDIFGEETKYWYFVESKAREIFLKYGFKEIRTPIIESTELFKRSVGETSDIVQKEMYTFKDKGGRSITLRPEGTAPVVRAYVENSMINLGSPIKLYYMGPMFRYERPQAGRQRQFHQIGVEIFGTDTPISDAEIIILADELLKAFGLKNYKIKINSIGCEKCRPKYKESLKNYYNPLLPNMCHDCQKRYETNIMRLLDCKVDSKYSKDAPVILDHLCEDCKTHFNKVIKYLDELNINYEVDPKIVRGLDYYTKTAFEIEHLDLGAQSAILGGGRYNSLVEEIGGRETPAIGFGVGVERIILALKQENIEIENPEKIDIYIAYSGEKTDFEALKLSKILKKEGLKVFLNLSERSIRNQMKHANKIKAKFVAIIGENELKTETVTIKNMISGEQFEVEKFWVPQILKEKSLLE
ncbi:histidyl-tRNA synthetase [Marinitoga hydrogenitolerans DSM 16785]|uniref:Histidine--tRNA ligase n=1 Tax=Marinitoga hydrogenitolerans (strain DSM 16785 / JCM 12826 / AT1271) TaxID=1122195 RepID=A0A1M4X6S0_MARH1|nr:histidine--tRNA ligase [Marinitoga hydrogenitolerans]SHE89137.1 histidyl-tRNA synthetase [Marinitoga hydrogenitolerans DSM 16785]